MRAVSRSSAICKVEWSEVRDELFPDGTLRDIYVLDTSIADWQRVLDGLRRGAFALDYALEGATAALPVNASVLFADERLHMSRLRIALGSVTIHCHFFQVDQIEFDIDPRDIEGQGELTAVVDFMRLVASACGKDVLLTPENLPDAPFLRVLPDRVAVEQLPSGSSS